MKQAVRRHHPKVVALLTESDELTDSSESFALFDWKMQKELARLSENPIFLLTLNSFEPAYVKLAKRYFSQPCFREASLKYYQAFRDVALKGVAQQAERLTRAMMEKSYTVWQRHLSPGEHFDAKASLGGM